MNSYQFKKKFKPGTKIKFITCEASLTCDSGDKKFCHIGSIMTVDFIFDNTEIHVEEHECYYRNGEVEPLDEAESETGWKEIPYSSEK